MGMLLRGKEFDVLADIVSYQTSCVAGEHPKVHLEGVMVPPKPAARTTGIVKVIYNNPATIVYWEDGSRTVVKCQPGDEFNRTIGFLMCVMKKVTGNTGRYNEVLKKYVYDYDADRTPDDMRKELGAFCNGRACHGCPLDKPGFSCGRGKWFLHDENTDAYMSDDEIRAHYDAMKGAKS